MGDMTAKPPVDESTSRLWRHRVVDVMAVPRSFLIVDELGLAAWARHYKGQAQIPGVEFYQDSPFSESTAEGTSMVNGG